MNENLRICVDVAEKLKDPSQINHALASLPSPYSNLSQNWPNHGLTNGLSSIALLYTILDEELPNQGWDEKANTYLRLCIDSIEQNGCNGFSLLEGLGGLCYTVFVASKNGTRYQELLSKLDRFLVEQLEKTFFYQVDGFLKENKPIPIEFYNFSHGISGILAYLILRKEEPDLHRLASECLYALVRLLSQKQVINGINVPSWYVTQDHQLNDSHKERFNQGTFILTKINGITGCLSVLSNALIEGVVVSGQYELILTIADWLKKQKVETQFGPAWPYLIPFDHSASTEKPSDDEIRDIWNCGTPCVSTSLFLVASTDQIEQMQIDYERAFQNLPAGPSILTDKDIAWMNQLSVIPQNNKICENVRGEKFKQPQVCTQMLISIFNSISSKISWGIEVSDLDGIEGMFDLIQLGVVPSSRALCEEKLNIISQNPIFLELGYEGICTYLIEDLKDQEKAKRLIDQGLHIGVALLYPKLDSNQK